MTLFVVLSLGAYLLLHLRPSGFMPDEDQGYLISLITLPLGVLVAAHRGGHRCLQQADP